MLSGQQLKFATLYALQKNAADAYRAAYPNSAPASAERSGSRLLKNVEVKAKIEEIRAKAVTKTAMTLTERREALAGIVRAEQAIFRGSTVHTADRIQAIRVDNDLAGEGSEAGANDALAGLLERVMK